MTDPLSQQAEALIALSEKRNTLLREHSILAPGLVSAVLDLQREMAEAAPALAAAYLAMRWRTMDSAPRDGREVDLWAGGRRWPVCHYHEGEWLHWNSFSVDEEPCWQRLYNATHWMPLPTPPTGGDHG